MDSKPQVWQNWARNLHRWGLREPVATLLEVSGPLNLVLAQGVYLIQPLFSASVSRNHLGTLAGILEDREETQMFVTYLREAILP